MSRCEADGLIQPGRQRVMIRNPQGLHTVADDLD